MTIERREMVKLTAGAALAAAAAAVPFVTGAADQEPNGTAADARPAGTADDTEYTERYQGRTIRVASAAAGGGVFIDGRPLHLMKFADDAYLSSMCHYEMAPTPLHAARRAVEELRGAALLPGHGTHSHVTTV
ncbi:tyrosinase family oxidase copper chaperone [Streptomyces sp. JB150]|uniref:tyrosinase family oxidase copper chaperone n=1 Tax=Streptomyces sp. JB150 TaxID=2714844 RepID=UPI0014091457|nr:tyrosinase family oxidase copper chaperone [Streptomyces sp. JB150]QIJ63529.1 copper transporter [Streptomyces sp. JB150]